MHRGRVSCCKSRECLSARTGAAGRHQGMNACLHSERPKCWSCGITGELCTGHSRDRTRFASYQLVEGRAWHIICRRSWCLQPLTLWHHRSLRALRFVSLGTVALESCSNSARPAACSERKARVVLACRTRARTAMRDIWRSTLGCGQRNPWGS